MEAACLAYTLDAAKLLLTLLTFDAGCIQVCPRPVNLGLLLAVLDHQYDLALADPVIDIEIDREDPPRGLGRHSSPVDRFDHSIETVELRQINAVDRDRLEFGGRGEGCGKPPHAEQAAGECALDCGHCNNSNYINKL